MKKKIGIILSSIPETGGGFQYELMITETVVMCQKYDITILTNKNFWIQWCKKRHISYIKYNWNTPSIKQMKAEIKFPIISLIYNRYVTSIGNILRKHRINLLICGSQGVYLPNYGIRTIRPVHDLMHRYEKRFPEIRIDYKERELIFSNVVKNADVVLVDSQLGKKQFYDCYLKKTYKKKKIIVLPFIPSASLLKKKEKYVNVPAKYVFYPAQFWLHKNHINLIKSIQLLKDKIPDIYLILVGTEKNSLKKIKKYLNLYNLQGYVSILGFVSEEELKFLYKHATVMVMPSYFGPTNIPPLEAMALGCPVAVSNKYAMQEQVGNAGLLFNPDSPKEIADCIQKIWTDKELRKKLVTSGYKQINKWKRKDFEEKLLNVIDSI